MSAWKVLFLILSVFVISGVVSQDINQMILEDGEYKNVLVAIDEGVPEGSAIIDNLKNMFTTGSSLLFDASDRRVFWKEISILVPNSWTRQPFYGIAQSESYYRANIRIFSGHESDEPIVSNHYGCGKEGLHMQISTGYLSSTSKCHDMDIVRYWARLRWGLMPEHYTGDEDTEQFYIDSNGTRQLTRCSVKTTDTYIDPDTNLRCGEEPSGGYRDQCIFQPECLQAECASLLLGSHCVRTIKKFCSRDSNDDAYIHNYEAPNLQNIKCGPDRSSAWEILYRTADFVNEQNTPMPPSTDTSPTFRFLQPPGVRRVVLVLDISGSMDRENRLNKLIQAATIFIMDLVPAGTELAIVSFHDYAIRNAPLREVRDDDSSREDLVNSMPRYTAGSTCIGCGIQEGINTLGVNTNGSYIFLLSDGEENVDPYIADVLGDVKSAGVVIDTIAITDEADEQMECLANTTGGGPFFCHDKKSSACVTDALLWTIVERPHLNQAPVPKVVKITDVEVPPRPDYSIKTVSINDKEGNDTMIAVTWLDFSDMDVIAEGPNGEFISQSDPRYNVDISTKTVTIRIPVASPGNWDITMLHRETSNETVGLAITTKQRHIGVETVDVHVFLSSRNVNFTADPKLGVFALVQRGHTAVKNVDVQAVIENSIGSVSTIIPLHDDGTGSDFMKDDGVYSGYFLNFDADGRYSVAVEVLGTTIAYGSRSRSRKRRAVTPTPPSSPSSFMRSASGGVFVVNNYIPNAPDILAPSRIQDFAYSSFSYENATVTLTWTAVGDDLDQGTASEYELRYSNDFDFLRQNFTDNPLVADHQIIDGNLSVIAPGGHLETLTILLPVVHYNLNYYFSIRAVDEAGNAGSMSNIVSLPIIEPLNVNISTTAPNVTATATANATVLNATSPASFSVGWTTDMNTTNSNDSFSMTDRTTLSRTDNTDQPSTTGYSPVSGTVQPGTHEPMTSEQGGSSTSFSSTTFEDPLTSGTFIPDVPTSTSLAGTFDPNATEPLVKTESTLVTSTGGSGQETHPTEPVVNTESTLLTSTEGDEEPHSTEPPPENPRTTEEPEEPIDLALIIAVSLTLAIVVFGGTVGAAFGIAVWKKKQARVRPAEDPSESYQTGIPMYSQ